MDTMHHELLFTGARTVDPFKLFVFGNPAHAIQRRSKEGQSVAIITISTSRTVLKLTWMMKRIPN